jgi:Ala-tRNA(Pro) deacylase
MTITERIRHLLESNQIDFKEIDHLETRTCEESAEARGEELKYGGKTILFKDKSDYRLFVISAALQIDNNKVRKILGSQKLRFATHEELMNLAGVESGALPPFGRDILPYDLYLDESIVQNEIICFNAGLLTKSFIMKTEEYLNLNDYKVCQFAKD